MRKRFTGFTNIAMMQIERQIEGIAERLAAVQPEALLLLGSAARNELSYRLRPDGSVEFFSDLEFLLVVPRRLSGEARRRLRHIIAEEERRIANPNPLFHIDVAVRERRRLATLPPTIFTFELRANGKLLYGEDLLQEVPLVTTANLDYANTREILFKRLWAVLLHLPRALLRRPLRERERRVMGYVLCRNVLDIPTVLLPHEGVLLPTYRARVAYLLREGERLRMITAFAPTFPRFLARCLERRLAPDFTAEELVPLYGEVIAALEQALTFLLPQGMSLDALASRSHHLFNESPRSRGELYGWGRLALRLGRRYGTRRLWQWLRLRRKSELTLGLLAMHRAALSYLGGEHAAVEASLQVAARILHRLWPPFEEEAAGDFATRWLALRSRWGDFWRAFIRLGDPAYAARFHDVMEWEDES